MKLPCCQLLLSLLICLATLSGCGDGRTKMGVVKVTGRVLCEGKPAGHVTVYFVPLQTGKSALVGKPAMGYADEDGVFTLGTYEKEDGAVVGKHQVRVGPPLGEAPANFKCDCALSDVTEVQQLEVVSGQDNDFEIILPKINPAQPTNIPNRGAQNAEIDD